MVPTGCLCVIPSRVATGEMFSLQVKLLGPVRPLACANGWNTQKPGLHSPFNRAEERKIQYLDNVLPQWQGRLLLDGGEAFEGPPEIVFNGNNQGVFPGDTRPIATFDGFFWTRPGLHFLKLVEPDSGMEAWANPVLVTEGDPEYRIYWGDPHWQTFFSDGIRCPEELYAFARDEAFLDFGAISDHMEAITDRQWDYFQAVTNDFNQPGRFATLIGQEWTHNVCGHRNIYYRGETGPVVRATDPQQNTLEKLWAVLDAYAASGGEAIAIPHHSANVAMGCDWDLGWNPAYEKAVEMYSVWGSSECMAEDGNVRPICHCKGEMRGRHVRDALARGFRFGFVGGGDIHDGRPGDCLNHLQPEQASASEVYPSGLTAVLSSTLTREAVFDAIRDGRTYATTQERILLDCAVRQDGLQLSLTIQAAAAEPIQSVSVIRQGTEVAVLSAMDDPRVLTETVPMDALAPDDYCYVRVLTRSGGMAWSSPVWGDA